MTLPWITASRLFLGVVFFVFGLNGFFHFLPLEPPPEEATAFPAAYFFPFLKIVETACGALLLANRFVPLAAAVLAPIVVNIVAFHVFLDPEALPVALALLGANVHLGIAYRDAFAGMLRMRAEPRALG